MLDSLSFRKYTEIMGGADYGGNFELFGEDS